MTRPRIEPRTLGPLVNTLPTRPILNTNSSDFIMNIKKSSILPYDQAVLGRSYYQNGRLLPVKSYTFQWTVIRDVTKRYKNSRKKALISRKIDHRQRLTKIKDKKLLPKPICSGKAATESALKKRSCTANSMVWQQSQQLFKPFASPWSVLTILYRPYPYLSTPPLGQDMTQG